jgi:hypothetical protein
MQPLPHMSTGSNLAPVIECRELAEQLKRMEITTLQGEAVVPFETDGASAEQQQSTRTRRGSNRKAATAPSTGGADQTGQLGGLKESQMLKQELKSRGLSVKGSKAELKARLAEAESADI